MYIVLIVQSCGRDLTFASVPGQPGRELGGGGREVPAGVPRLAGHPGRGTVPQRVGPCNYGDRERKSFLS